MRLTWGDLRGQYFQNAFIVGTLYVDVSNDTVNPSKPKVEILNFEDADFRPIRDFVHFSQVATSYWNITPLPNHVVPELAPYFPLVFVGASTGVRIECPSDYMSFMTMRSGFAPSEKVLEAEPMHEGVFALMRQHLVGTVDGLPETSSKGRRLALQACRDYRAAGWHRSPERRDQAVRLLLAVNQALTALSVTATPKA